MPVQPFVESVAIQLGVACRVWVQELVVDTVTGELVKHADEVAS